MTSKKNICTTQQSLPRKQNFNDLFSELKPLDPFDVKKEELSAQLCSLLSFSEKSRTEFSNLSGWKKSRISSILNGKGNPTFKTLWEFASFLGYEADLNFRKPSEAHAKQPWSLRSVEPQYTIYTNAALLFKCQTARDVAKDMLEGNHQEHYISISMPRKNIESAPVYMIPTYNIPAASRPINIKSKLDIKKSV
ncbi:MAG: helix-turn-helix domain-containing protein [Mucilaginibacter sp.]